MNEYAVLCEDCSDVISSSHDRDVTVRIPMGMYNKGTLYVHVLLAPAEKGRGEENPFEADWVVHQTGILTTCTTDQATAHQVTNDNPEEKVNATSLLSLGYSVSSSIAAAAI